MRKKYKIAEFTFMEINEKDYYQYSVARCFSVGKEKIII